MTCRRRNSPKCLQPPDRSRRRSTRSKSTINSFSKEMFSQRTSSRPTSTTSGRARSTKFACAHILTNSFSTTTCEATLARRLSSASERERPDVLKRREDWFESQLDLDPGRLVFLDETWTSTNLACNEPADTAIREWFKQFESASEMRLPEHESELSRALPTTDSD